MTESQYRRPATGDVEADEFTLAAGALHASCGVFSAARAMAEDREIHVDVGPYADKMMAFIDARLAPAAD